MTTVTDRVADQISETVEHVEDTAKREAAIYAHGERRPVGGYAVLITLYGVLTTLLGVLARRRRASWQPTPLELAELGIATHKLSRLIAKDSVTSAARFPFTRYEKPSGEGEVVEEVRGEGLRHAVGELITCPFCMAVWVATALAFVMVLAPRAGRVVLAAACAVAGSDFLQLAYAILERASERG